MLVLYMLCWVKNLAKDALRTAERRAAKAEADLEAEKAWVANALSNHSYSAVITYINGPWVVEHYCKVEVVI